MCWVEKERETEGERGRIKNNKKILPLSHFVCPLFHFRMSQNTVLFLKVKVINLLMFLLYPYFINNSIFC